MRFKLKLSALCLGLLLVATTPASFAANDWECQVAILQGFAAGGSVKKQASGIYVDTKKTEALNTLAAEGWEVMAVAGAAGANHTVYLRRDRRR